MVMPLILNRETCVRPPGKSFASPFPPFSPSEPRVPPVTDPRGPVGLHHGPVSTTLAGAQQSAPVAGLLLGERSFARSRSVVFAQKSLSFYKLAPKIQMPISLNP